MFVRNRACDLGSAEQPFRFPWEETGRGSNNVCRLNRRAFTNTVGRRGISLPLFCFNIVGVKQQLSTTRKNNRKWAPSLK